MNCAAMSAQAGMTDRRLFDIQMQIKKQISILLFLCVSWLKISCLGATGWLVMITLRDCMAFCGLTEKEVLAIAEHEHVPEIAPA